MADYLNYVLSNPDLRENAEALGLTNAEMAEWGQWHFNSHGKNEGRQNTPIAITNPEGYTQTLGPEHYQGRDVEDVLQASVRSAAGGDFDESMWTARQAIDPTWNLGQYTAEGWNLAPDVPYKRGILGDTIGVDTGVGQIWSEGDPRFLQDRYIDAAIANDFPVGWVGKEGTWKGPDELAGYWSDLTNAIRNEAGELRAIRDRPTTGWADTEVLDVGDRWSGNIRTDGTDTTSRVESGAAGSENLLAYRPWTKNYWSEYIPKESQGLLYMNKPQRDYGLAYLPGEHRDPVVWRQWADDHKGHIPGGGWRFTPESYTVQSGSRKGKPAPWRFTSGPASATNIYANPWKATSMNLTPAQGTGWQGFLSDLGATPAIDTTTATLLGV
jgi:hypothetical protein